MSRWMCVWWRHESQHFLPNHCAIAPEIWIRNTQIEFHSPDNSLFGHFLHWPLFLFNFFPFAVCRYWMLLFSVMFARTQFWFRWVCVVCEHWTRTISTGDLEGARTMRPDVISFKYCLKRYNLIESKIITDFGTSTRHQWGLCSRMRRYR